MVFLEISQNSQENNVNFMKFLRTPLDIEHLWWLLLLFQIRYANFLLLSPFTYRSSRPEVFCKKGVLTSFTKLTGKHRCQSLFFCKSHLFLRPATLLKQRLWRKCFPVNFAKFLRTPFLTEHLRWLLLNEEILTW